jgi:SNF2 family DNA or RNA helicase
LFGGTDPERREKNIKKFIHNPLCRVFIGNIRAAGIAITLTAASEVAFVESSWVPADNAQAAMRVHRIGQTRPVRCRFFGLVNSSDEKVQQVLKRKTRDITKLFDEDTKKDFIDPFAD